LLKSFCGCGDAKLEALICSDCKRLQRQKKFAPRVRPAATALLVDVKPAALSTAISWLRCLIAGYSSTIAYAYYRWWCSSRINLTFGENQTFSCVIDGAKWISVFGESGTTSAASQAGFAQALKNAAHVGVTFGGQMFAGHGVWTTSGNATFRISDISIK
jgi:hypothetical protein